MDLSLIIFIGVVAFFTLRGFGKGLFKSVARIASLLSGYVAAVLYTAPLATLIETHYQLQGVAASITAAALMFAGAAFGASLLFWLLEILFGNKEPRSAASGVGGAMVGLAVGIVVALAIVWSLGLVRDINAGKGEMNMEPLAADENEQPSSPVEVFANQMASRLMDNSVSETLRETVSDPEFLHQLQSENLTEILNDSRLLKLAENMFSRTPADEPPQQAKAAAPQVPVQEPSQDASAGQSFEAQVSTAGTLDSAQRADKVEKEPQIYHWIDEQGRSHFSTADPG